MRENRCVICESIIPEGRMVCPECENSETSFTTVKIRVLLNKITNIVKFVKLASMCTGDVVIKSGNFAVDAKSLIGLYGLDLSKPVVVEFYGYIPNEVKEEMKKYII